jgi:hypothetical protein
MFLIFLENKKEINEKKQIIQVEEYLFEKGEYL